MLSGQKSGERAVSAGMGDGRENDQREDVLVFAQFETSDFRMCDSAVMKTVERPSRLCVLVRRELRCSITGGTASYAGTYGWGRNVQGSQ